jgi:hypothetical protein
VEFSHANITAPQATFNREASQLHRQREEDGEVQSSSKRLITRKLPRTSKQTSHSRHNRRFTFELRSNYKLNSVLRNPISFVPIPNLSLFSFHLKTLKIQKPETESLSRSSSLDGKRS